MATHNNRKHALLSASGALRWMECTPSARLEEQHGEKKSSVYAAEGTLAHELAELFLRHDVLQDLSDVDFTKEFDRIICNDLFTEDMPENIAPYVDYCRAQYIEAQNADKFALIKLEQKLDLTQYVPDSFGTADCSILANGTLEIIDLKYGKGVPVYAIWNRQLMLYALGALYEFECLYDIDNVKLTIVQPRIDNISTWTTSVAELYEWADTVLKERATLAYAGEGELKAGDWCKFCGVKNRCRKLYEESIAIAKHDFAKPNLLQDSEIVEILEKAPGLIDWLNSLQEYAQEKAIEGKEWPGFKLVEGRSVRKWADPALVEDVLLSKCPELSSEDLYDLKLKSLTVVEKLIGKTKFAKVTEGIVIKPTGSPTLVPVSDKRPALGIGQAKIDFKN